MARNVFEFLKILIINLKLDYCCCCVPVRSGLLITGYISVIGSTIYLVGTAEGSLSTPVSLVQDQILDDKANSVIPIAVYAAELAFGMVLLCGLYRRDIPLLRCYMWFCIGDLIVSSLAYAWAVSSIGVLTAALLITLIVFQMYLIILVRSMIVEFRLAKKNMELPTIVMSTLKRQHDNMVTFPETVVVHQPESNDKIEQTKAIPVEIIDKKEETKDKKKEAKDKKKEIKDKKEEAKEKKKEIKDKKEGPKDKKGDTKDKKGDTNDKKEDTKDKKENAKDKKEDTKDNKEDTKAKKEDTIDKKKETTLEIVDENPKETSVSKEKNQL